MLSPVQIRFPESQLGAWCEICRPAPWTVFAQRLAESNADIMFRRADVTLYRPCFRNNHKTPPQHYIEKRNGVRNIRCRKTKCGILHKLPPCEIVVVVHHVRIVPTLALTTKQPLAGSCVALRLMLHSCLQDTRVRKIN